MYIWNEVFGGDTWHRIPDNPTGCIFSLFIYFYHKNKDSKTIFNQEKGKKNSFIIIKNCNK